MNAGKELELMGGHSFSEEVCVDGTWGYSVDGNKTGAELFGKGASYLVEGTFRGCLHEAEGHHGGLLCDVG